MLCYEYIKDSYLSRESNRDPLPCRLPFQLSHPSDSNASENSSHIVLKNNRKVNSLNLRPTNIGSFYKFLYLVFLK